MEITLKFSLMNNDFFTEDLAITKQVVLKNLAKVGNYAVVEPGKDAIYMDKADAGVKAETENLVKQSVDNASFIADSENNPASNDDGIKREISEATKDIFKTVITVETVDNNKLFILY